MYATLAKFLKMKPFRRKEKQKVRLSFLSIIQWVCLQNKNVCALITQSEYFFRAFFFLRSPLVATALFRALEHRDLRACIRSFLDLCCIWGISKVLASWFSKLNHSLFGPPFPDCWPWGFHCFHHVFLTFFWIWGIIKMYMDCFFKLDAFLLRSSISVQIYSSYTVCQILPFLKFGKIFCFVSRKEGKRKA